MMQIPGLSAPIPPGAQFGYQPGGWGKPPVDEEGNPLYGDVFGQFKQDADDENVRILPCDLTFACLLHQHFLSRP